MVLMASFIDGYLDRSKHIEVFTDGTVGWSGTPKEFNVGKDDQQIVCFDVRKLHSAGLSREQKVYDLRFLFKHDGELSRLVQSVAIPSRDSFLDLERRFSAHTRAISEASMDINNVPLKELIPDDVRVSYMKARIQAMKELWSQLSSTQIEEYEKNVLPVFMDILKIEEAGIRIDEHHVQVQLKRSDLAAHEERFFQNLRQNVKSGFIKTKINPVGSKTWRLRVETNAFNCMGIPHGTCRESVISRFAGGSIITLDFNAIDYRCLVSATNHPRLNDDYKDARDFHARTCEMIGEPIEMRDVVKKCTYAIIYGASIETIQQSTKLPWDVLGPIISRMRNGFLPITTFRMQLSEKAREQGWLTTPDGHRIEIDKLDHDGKIVGLYAQTYSSSMFNKALNQVIGWLKLRNLGAPNASAMSKVIFTVHDEIVLDMHPDELQYADFLASAMEAVTGFAVKKKVGKNYEEATK